MLNTGCNFFAPEQLLHSYNKLYSQNTLCFVECHLQGWGVKRTSSITHLLHTNQSKNGPVKWKQSICEDPVGFTYKLVGGTVNYESFSRTNTSVLPLTFVLPQHT